MCCEVTGLVRTSLDAPGTAMQIVCEDMAKRR